MTRRGITIVQLLIVILVVLLIVGILVPVILQAQARAARVETTESLRKCAVAVHDFHETYRTFPDAYNIGGTYKQPVSMWFQLLPFIGAQKLYDAGTVDAIVPTFLAASDRGRSHRAGLVLFAGNVRVFAYDTVRSKANEVGIAIDVPAGVLKSGLTLPRIVDGTTNVMMMSTRYGNCSGQKTWYAADAHGTASLGALPARGVGGFMGAGAYTTPPTSQNEPLTAIFQLAPTDRNCVPEGSIFGHSFDNVGLITAMCDASVRNIGPGITPLVFGKMISPCDSGGLAPDWAQE